MQNKKKTKNKKTGAGLAYTGKYLVYWQFCIVLGWDFSNFRESRVSLFTIFIMAKRPSHRTFFKNNIKNSSGLYVDKI